MKKELRTYKIKASKKAKGWKKTALVANPATSVEGLAFSKEGETLAFSDELKLRIAAPVMIPKTIYRDATRPEFNDGEPFNTRFDAEEIEAMLMQLMSDPDNLKEAFLLGHKGEAVPCYLLEIWIVDQPKLDRSFSTFGIEVEKGSVFAVVQFTDKEYFENVVSEGITSFSIEGNFELELEYANEQKLNYSDTVVVDGEKVLMLKRTETEDFEPNTWGFAGGKIEPNESAQEAGARELMEETGLTYTEIVPIDVRDNEEEGTTTSYFAVQFSDYDGELNLSDEHAESGWFTLEEIDGLDIILGQNERLKQIGEKAIATINQLNKEKSMKEGEEFDVGGVLYVIKDGKPVPKESTEEVEAEKEKEGEAEKETDKVEKVEMEDAAPMNETKVVELITKTVAPMIEEAMKAVVDSVIKATDTEGADKSEKEELKFEKEGNPNGWYDFLSKKSK